VAALCATVDGAGSAAQVLRGALPILRDVLGEQVALDLRTPTPAERPTGAGAVAAPLIGGGRRFGELRASGFDMDPATAEAFATAAGWVVGAGMARHDHRMDVSRANAPLVVPEVAHHLRSALATIGVAASTLQARGADLAPGLRDQLLLDIEANVEILGAEIDRLTGSDDGPRFDA
jgi:hypothetical protein